MQPSWNMLQAMLLCHHKAWQLSRSEGEQIPHEPEKIYKQTGWISLGDWLGNIQNQRKTKLPYEQTKAFVQAIGIKTWQQYWNWSVSGERPPNIPAAPDKAYFEFEGWGKFLGTERIANQNKTFWDYDVAKQFLEPFKIKTKSKFNTLCKNGTLPNEIPRDPATHYRRKETWKSYVDFFSETLS